jgi:predicted Fe-Mo cluster-binding NifX family protein
MKIAVVTDDEITISQHFGRASLYVVYEVEDGKIKGKETRPKMGHKHFAFKDERPHVHGERHGYDLASLNRHVSMAEVIKECQVLIVGGMGMAAYESMRRFNIEPIVTDVSGIEDAVKLYVEGKLPTLINRVD